MVQKQDNHSRNSYLEKRRLGDACRDWSTAMRDPTGQALEKLVSGHGHIPSVDCGPAQWTGGAHSLFLWSLALPSGMYFVH